MTEQFTPDDITKRQVICVRELTKLTAEQCSDHRIVEMLKDDYPRDVARKLLLLSRPVHFPRACPAAACGHYTWAHTSTGCTAVGCTCKRTHPVTSFEINSVRKLNPPKTIEQSTPRNPYAMYEGDL